MGKNSDVGSEKVVVNNEENKKHIIKEEIQKEDNIDKATGSDCQSENFFGRVKARLSSRKSKKNSNSLLDKKEQNSGEINSTENKSEKVYKKVIDDNKQHNQCLETNEKEKNKENVIQRLLRFFSFGSKKKGNYKDQPEEDETGVEPLVKTDDEKQESIENKSSINNTNEQTEILEVQKEDELIEIITKPVLSKPPSFPPSGRAAFLAAGPPRPPCSATASQSRPISQLDSALKKFTLSTAASRENLRTSHQNLAQMEDTIKTMTLSRNNSLRLSARGAASRTSSPGPTTIPILLSASLTDLRQKQSDNGGHVRTSLMVN